MKASEPGLDCMAWLANKEFCHGEGDEAIA
jgi:hypothetical protein